MRSSLVKRRTRLLHPCYLSFFVDQLFAFGPDGGQGGCTEFILFVSRFERHLCSQGKHTKRLFILFLLLALFFTPSLVTTRQHEWNLGGVDIAWNR